MLCAEFENIWCELSGIVPGQFLGSHFLEYQQKMTNKYKNWRNNIVAVITRETMQ